MTILTKPFSEKKGDKAVTPLVLNEQATPPSAPEDVESQQRRMPRILIFPTGTSPHRVTTATTLCLLLTAISVVGVGIVGGKILYDQYLRAAPKQYEFDGSRFEGWAQIPLSDEDEEFQKKIVKDYFQENFEINDDEKYEKIDVPDFRDGRSGRFIHDFNTNTTGIIDITGHRCFVMPLNRDNVLPPKSLFDLIHKMWEGYYKVNTDIVRRNMKVVLPPIKDTKSIGGYISSECDGLPIYRLENYVGGVVKRSADEEKEAVFSQFAGQGLFQIDIANWNEVRAYEENLNKH
ncbi:integral membrane protein 2B isoform X2 [Diorhabda carinulata]|uniref:integral membrane protein 2B isoform X2 n=1 Tax=Diorhabda sublineata TaxID=1163346 RepID=UPI0024E04B03|nr:integral membrane protein 2B isoform X2 [Diorhabda sublineata]XP_057660477.1 integral membrane protein 2B isoform X2 [Diorhabda carinulata]